MWTGLAAEDSFVVFTTPTPIAHRIEVTALAVSRGMGGEVGMGTVACALAIGPIVQVLSPKPTIRLEPVGTREPTVGASLAQVDLRPGNNRVWPCRSHPASSPATSPTLSTSSSGLPMPTGPMSM